MYPLRTGDDDDDAGDGALCVKTKAPADDVGIDDPSWWCDVASFGCSSWWWSTYPYLLY